MNNTTGNSNTAIGRGALLSNTTGAYNLGIGFHAGDGLTTGYGNINIGHNVSGLGAESNTTRIGRSVLINRTFIAGIRGATTGVADAVPVVIDSLGQLGTISSSRRFKWDIQDMADASANLMRLRPVTFRYNQCYADGSYPIQYGLIAEEVAEVFPDVVVRSADGQIETVQYYKIDAMLLNEVQKLHRAEQQQTALNADLVAQLADQQREIQLLQGRLKALEALIERSQR